MTLVKHLGTALKGVNLLKLGGPKANPMAMERYGCVVEISYLGHEHTVVFKILYKGDISMHILLRCVYKMSLFILFSTDL